MRPKKPVKGIETINPNEVEFARIRKHPFGIVTAYLLSGVGLVAAAALTMTVMPGVSGADQGTSSTVLALLILIIITVFVVLILLAATYVYQQSMLIITDCNLTQVLQKGIFNRQVSELSMANVEDVSADQKGFFATFFNFGELKIETAGEVTYFYFKYCPNPSYYGRVILEARQQYLAKVNRGEEPQPLPVTH